MTSTQLNYGFPLLLVLLLFLGSNVTAEEITCGPKTITVEGGKLVRIKHEDGTVHSGGSVSRNWVYDGKSIMHNLLKKKIPCGTKPMTRGETVASLSKRFSENPSSYGLSAKEGQAMTAYAARLMNSSGTCHLLVDGAKSTQRAGMYWIDCNDKSGTSRRHWISERDLLQGTIREAVKPISERAATEICSKELKARTTNPSTYDPAILTGTSSRTIAANGRNVVEIRFSAKNSFGVEGDFLGKCILEGGRMLEVTVTEE